MKIFKMAYRNVLKYWRHYIIVSIFVVGGTVFLLSTTMINETKDMTEKAYNQEIYGDWFVRLNKEEYDQMVSGTYAYFNMTTGEYEERSVKDIWDQKCEEEENYQYTFVYEQGNYNDQLVGYIDSASYDLFGIQITDGSDKSNIQDIVVSESTGLKVGDKVTLDLSEQEFVVTGIFSNENEAMPVILTNYNDGAIGYYYSNNAVVIHDVGFDTYTFSYLSNIGGESVTTKIPLNYVINEHGYDAKVYNSQFQSSFDKLQAFVKMILLLAIVISVLTTTSLKRRAKESTLLRGIGATAGQLVKLTIDEMSIILFFTTIIGYIISYIILRVYGSMQTKNYGFYLYSFSKPLIFWYCVGIIITIICITFLPMRSSAIGALTGAFEAPKPKMLEGRESSWVSQTSRVMAKRQLREYSKLTLALTIFVLLLGGYFITYRALKVTEPVEIEPGPYDGKAYTSSSFNNQEDVDTYVSFFTEEDQVSIVDTKKTTAYTDCDIVKYDQDFVSMFDLKEGRLIENSHEVVININTKLYNQKIELQDEELDFSHDGEPYVYNGKLIIIFDNNEGSYYYDQDEKTYVQIPDGSEFWGEWVNVDGKVYTDFISEYNDDGNITGYQVNLTGQDDGYVHFDVDDPKIESNLDYGKDCVIRYDNKIYTQYKYENNRIAVRNSNDENWYQINNYDYEMLTDYIVYQGEKIFEYEKIYDGDKVVGYATYKDPKLNDSLLIEGEEYKIVGIVSNRVAIDIARDPRWHNNIIAYENNNVYISEEDFARLGGIESQTVYSIFDYSRKSELITYVYNHFQKDNQNIIALSNAQSRTQDLIDISSFDPVYFFILVICGIALCLFLTLNSMLNDIKNFAILHLLGMTNEDLVRVHLHMALEMTLRTVVVLGIYLIFLLLGFSYTIDILSIVLLITGILVFYLCVYLIPAIYITKTDLIETLMEGE